MANPLVTVTIPTVGRFTLARAIECYASQTYKNTQLVVLANEGCKHQNLAMKRNLAIKLAMGEFICHFDDDDWSGPNRIEDQLSYFTEDIDIVGYTHTYWWDEVRHVASLYKGGIWGATLMYRRSFALAHPFNETCELAEDSKFINAAKPERVRGIPADNNMVCTMHSNNAERRYDAFWPIVPKGDLPRGFVC